MFCSFTMAAPAAGSTRVIESVRLASAREMESARACSARATESLRAAIASESALIASARARSAAAIESIRVRSAAMIESLRAWLALITESAFAMESRCARLVVGITVPCDSFLIGMRWVDRARVVSRRVVSDCAWTVALAQRTAAKPPPIAHRVNSRNVMISPRHRDSGVARRPLGRVRRGGTPAHG